MELSVTRFKMSQVVLHWAHVAAFLTLVVTGAILFFPQLSFLAAGSTSRIIHRAAAALYLLLPIIYLVVESKGLMNSAKAIFLDWDMDDLRWFKAAPSYYFFGAEEGMPPQRKFNTGQRINYVGIILGSGVISVTGLVLWFGKGVVSPELLQLSLALHDLAAIPAIAMFCLHVYLGAIHPLMRDSFGSIISGKMPVRFAREHHGKWLQEVTEQR